MRKRQKPNSLINDFCCLYNYLSHRRRRQLKVLLLLMLLSSLSEMVSVGAIFPLLSALGNAPGLLQAPKLQWLFGTLQIETTQRLVLVMALAFVAALGAANGLRLLTLHVRSRLAAAIATDISSQVYSSTLYQHYSFHLQQNSSDLIQTVTIDVDRLTNNVLSQGLEFIANTLLAPALIITLVLIDWQVAIGAALILGTSYVVVFRTRQRLLQQNSALLSQAGQGKVKIVQEGIGGIREVLLNQRQPFFSKVYQRHDQVLRQASAANLVIARSPIFVMEFIALSSIALLALGLGRNGDFSQAVPVLGSLALGAKRLVPALQGLFASLATIQGARASLDRVLRALDQPLNPLLSLPIPLPLKLGQEIRFDQVWFRYQEDTDWVLRNLNLTIAAKTTVAFVGSTGSGKSTTADLLLGLLQPQKGQIFIDGLPLEGERLLQWQQGIAHVPQHIYLSDSTLAENIAFGIPAQEIDFEQVQRAARLAQIEDFIENLPAGYDTYVGERGIRLSGGQRQRIGIARALHKNASVIVFDEATSALDNATEREVMASIEGLSGEFTIILIAHRLSTIQQCDLIVELSQGRVEAQGSYRELLSRSSSFKCMAEVET